MNASKPPEVRIELPPPPQPLGRYIPAVSAGGMLFLSGQLPLADGGLTVKGTLGADVSIEEGRRAAKLAVRNALSIAQAHLRDLDRIAGVVRLGVTLVTTDSFSAHAVVADAASDHLREFLGEERSRHTRLITGALSLSLGSPLVLELIFALRDAKSRDEIGG